MLIYTMKKSIISLLLLMGLFITNITQAQNIKRVLYVGNSYVTTNNLPLMVANVAAAHGDSIQYDSYAPGSHTFQLHCTGTATLSKIAQGTWDYVVLQEQSQRPSFPPAQVATDCLPYAAFLDSAIHAADSCVETIFYMTWGRKNGDAANCGFYPPLCTYAGMQDRLRDSYLLMGQQNNASVAPVGCAWREVRSQNPTFNLYMPDESHPSTYGTYLAACVFYSTFFKKPVSALGYTAGIAVADAQLIQQQCNALMFDSLATWFGYGNIPFASFNTQHIGALANFINTSLNATSYTWSFGDGATSTLPGPSHTYTANGTYVVTLTAATSCNQSIVTDTVVVNTLSLPGTLADQQFVVAVESGYLWVEGIYNSEWRMNIANLVGQVVYAGQVAEGRKVKLKKGIYTVALMNGKDALEKHNKKIAVTGSERLVRY